MSTSYSLTNIVRELNTFYKSSISIPTIVKGKTTSNLLPRLSVIGQNPPFSASPPLFKVKEVCHITVIMSSCGNQGQKKTTLNQEIPSFQGSGTSACSAIEVVFSLSR
jgi:hypothetical protein